MYILKKKFFSSEKHTIPLTFLTKCQKSHPDFAICLALGSACFRPKACGTTQSLWCIWNFSSLAPRGCTPEHIGWKTVRTSSWNRVWAWICHIRLIHAKENCKQPTACQNWVRLWKCSFEFRCPLCFSPKQWDTGVWLSRGKTRRLPLVSGWEARTENQYPIV